jgi:hypothetical protein
LVHKVPESSSSLPGNKDRYVMLPISEGVQKWELGEVGSSSWEGSLHGIHRGQWRAMGGLKKQVCSGIIYIQYNVHISMYI